jgi:hypothetical protein
MLKRILVLALLLCLVPATLLAAPPPPNRSYIGRPMNGTWTIVYHTETHDAWVYSYTAHGNTAGLFNSAGEFRVNKYGMGVRFIDFQHGVVAHGTINPDHSMNIWIPVNVGFWPPHWEHLR